MVEPLGTLNKGFTVRNTLGLPLNASYACRVMQGVSNHTDQWLFFLLIHTSITKLYQGVAPPGLTYLTYPWKAKQGEKKRNTSKASVYARVCMF